MRILYSMKVPSSIWQKKLKCMLFIAITTTNINSLKSKNSPLTSNRSHLRKKIKTIGIDENE